MWSKSLLLVLLYFSQIPLKADEVFWLPNKSIHLASNFKDGKLPCSGQNIVFPDTVEGSILISSLSISGLVLPIDGEITFEEGTVIFGADPDDNCTSIGNAYYKDDQVSSWAHPNVWSSERFNEATPDAERVPCYNDTVFFPRKGQFSVMLPDRPQTVKAVKETVTERVLNLNSQQFIMSADSSGLLTTTSGKEVSDRPCHAMSHGCPCQNYALDIECNLKYCAPPQCSNPIKPEGHCCELCGASLLIDITNKFDMTSFKQTVSDIVDSYGAQNFVYHVSLLPHKYEDIKNTKKVQVIVLDKGKYNGACQQVINDINYKLSGDWVQDNVLLFSGSAPTQSGVGGKIFVSVLFLVLITMAGLFGYYYKWSVSDLRDLRGGLGRGMLSRLQRRTDSVMTLARRDSTVSTATTTGTAFRNPLYSSMRERVQVVEAVNEE